MIASYIDQSTLGELVFSNIKFTTADLLAHGLSLSFILMGLVALGAGDMRIGQNRLIRIPVDIVGSDRVTFGIGLLAFGYVLQRWLFRKPGRPLQWTLEIQVFALFVVAGYVAYRVGGFT